MMCRRVGSVLFFVLILFFSSCNHSHHPTKNSYKNVHWKIISFEDTVKNFRENDYLYLDAEFVTEKDSVFWNSHHEGADKLFIQLQDTLQHPFYFPFYQASEGDSFSIIAPKTIVLRDIFQLTQCPPFLQKDSIITCYIKIKKKFFSLDDVVDFAINKDEQIQIQNFLEKNQPLFEKDTNGIIWLEPLPIPKYKNRNNIKEATVAYSGYFLDGRMIDHTDSLGIRYNDTLQLIEGLNYVIKKLDIGQSAKIIIPSQLAFGSRGSFNKTIPPYTPMLYEIKLIQIQ